MAIAIVDDSSAARTILKAILADEGYEDTVLLESGPALLRYVSTPNCGLTLVLLDFIMPQMDGLTTCREFKRLAEGQNIPVVMLTASTDPSTIENAFKAGASDFLVKPFERVELLARMRSALALKQEGDRRRARERELVIATRRLADANKQLQRLSAQDGLTGISNRRFFDESLAQEWKRAARTRGPLSIALVDVDHFKQYNDSHGHLQGDACLRAVAGVLKASVRRPADVAARYGGEEFVLLMPETDTDGALRCSEGARIGVERLVMPVGPSGALAPVTVSVGVATGLADPSDNPESLIAAADKALYSAKRLGRNRCITAAQSGEALVPTSPPANRDGELRVGSRRGLDKVG